MARAVSHIARKANRCLAWSIAVNMTRPLTACCSLPSPRLPAWSHVIKFHLLNRACPEPHEPQRPQSLKPQPLVPEAVVSWRFSSVGKLGPKDGQKARETCLGKVLCSLPRTQRLPRSAKSALDLPQVSCRSPPSPLRGQCCTVHEAHQGKGDRWLDPMV